MQILIEYYDKDVLKNIMSPLTLHPDKVVYLYDSGLKDEAVFFSLKKCFAKHFDVEVEHIPVDIRTVESIRKATCAVLERNGPENCMLELTGGSELMMIAGYKAGITSALHNVPRYMAAGNWAKIGELAMDVKWRADKIMELERKDGEV